MNSAITQIFVERQHANDDGYSFIEQLVKNHTRVAAGTAIATLEGSKAVFEVEAPVAGYIHFQAGAQDHIEVGQCIAIVTATQEFDPNHLAKTPGRSNHKAARNVAADDDAIIARLTNQAREYAERNKIDLTPFADHDVITLEDIKTAAAVPNEVEMPREVFDEIYDSPTRPIERIGLIGAGLGAVQALDIIVASPTQIAVGLFDDEKTDRDLRIAGMEILGPVDIKDIERRYEDGEFDSVFLCVSTSIAFRQSTYEKLSQLGIPFANLIHPNVTIGLNATLGSGNILLAQTTVGPCTKIGNNNFVSAHCNLEHHNTIGDHNTFGPNVITSGRVEIGSCIRFGTGIFIEPGLTIGDRSVIASGAIITHDIEAQSLVKTRQSLSVRRRT